MSKILFWSPLHGQGQTSNLHVTAFLMSLLHKKKVLMMQTHFSMNNLESPLVGMNVDKRIDKESELFQDIGLDTAVTYSLMNQLNFNMLESCCLTFPEASLLLLPGTEIKNRETFDRDIGKVVRKVIEDANKCVDMVLIDGNSSDDELSMSLMSISDMIVVNLTQRKYVLERFFSMYGEKLIDNKKVFYLLGDYDDNSSYNINNCRRKYKRYLTNTNSGVIPYCTKYMDAQNECDVIRFMQEGLHITEDSDIEKLFRFIKKAFSSGKYIPAETDYFFHRSRLSIEKMFDKLDIPIGERRRGEQRNEFK